MKTWTHFCNTEEEFIEIYGAETCDWCGQKPSEIDRLEIEVDQLYTDFTEIRHKIAHLESTLMWKKLQNT